VKPVKVHLHHKQIWDSPSHRNEEAFPNAQNKTFH
jgi:hypothetical protein